MYAVFTVRRLSASSLEHCFLSLHWRRIDIPTIIRGRFAMKLAMLQSGAAHYTDPQKSSGQVAVGVTVFLNFVTFPLFRAILIFSCYNFFSSVIL